MYRWLVLLTLLLASSACVGATRQLDPRAEHAEAGALAFWYGEDTASVDRHEWPVARLLDQECAVSKMDADRAAFFVRTAAYIDRVLRSDTFASIMKAKPKWPLTDDSGERILGRLRSTGAQINVFLYSRDDAHACRDDLAVNENLNAFTPMRGDRDGHMLLLHEPYLDKAIEDDDVPGLARTVVHESLHSLGYTHGGLEPGSAPYNGSVPVFVGCVLEHWRGAAGIAWIAANCHRATSDQAQQEVLRAVRAEVRKGALSGR